MRILLKVFSIALSLTVLSCRQDNNKKTTINPEWAKLNLPNGWTLYTPKTFTNKIIQGMDSEPGVLASNQDSIYLEYDSGTEKLKNEKCDFQSSFDRAKEGIENGFYKNYYKLPLVHTAFIDTIDEKIAVIVKPTTSGEGTVGISISDCETGEWLGINGTNLTFEKEKLVLAIFKSIKLTKTN